MVVTFFAAFMSTISTQMNWGASYLIRDFIGPLFPKLAADDRKMLLASQCISVLVLVQGLFVSWVMVEQQVSVDEAWKILAALGAGTDWSICCDGSGGESMRGAKSRPCLLR